MENGLIGMTCKISLSKGYGSNPNIEGTIVGIVQRLDTNSASITSSFVPQSTNLS